MPLRWCDNPGGNDPRSPGSVMRADLGGPGHYALIEPEGDGFTRYVIRPRAFPDTENSGEASDTGTAKVQVAAYLARLERDWP